VHFRSARYDQALAGYSTCLQEDPENEILEANLSATMLKLGKYENCITYCDQAITRLEQFIRYSAKMQASHHFPMTQQQMQLSNQSCNLSNNFLIKLYLRKAKALQLTGDF
jgi:tetratricopeptide (TPR) repeat protein